jgi:hypothetical protein
MDEIMRNLGPPLGVFLLSIVIYLWGRGAHRRDAARARRRTHPAE